eukprot:30937-Pelagococcus_subviridis.AAC.28
MFENKICPSLSFATSGLDGGRILQTMSAVHGFPMTQPCSTYCSSAYSDSTPALDSTTTFIPAFTSFPNASGASATLLSSLNDSFGTPSASVSYATPAAVSVAGSAIAPKETLPGDLPLNETYPDWLPRYAAVISARDALDDRARVRRAR